jgi:hypothetical protein
MYLSKIQTLIIWLIYRLIQNGIKGDMMYVYLLMQKLLCKCKVQMTYNFQTK